MFSKSGAYPAKLKKVLIITPPIWFKAPFKILRLFVREKLRDRVHMLSQSQLRKHLPMSCLPIELGGQLKLEHEKWIDHCLKQLKENAIESGAGGSSSFISITDSASSQRSSTGSSMAFGTASSTSRSNSLPVAPIDSQFVFNCELIGQSLCSFNTDSSDLTDSIHKRTGRNGHDDDDDDEDDEEDFHKVHSELDLSGLSEQLTGLCDKLATNFEADLGIPSNSISDSCTTTGSSGDAATSLCTVESGNDAIATKTYTNGTPTNGNTNGSINGNTNGTSLPKHHHHHTIVSEQNSIDSTGTGGCTRIGKHKPDNIPIRLEQVRVESINGQNGQLTCSSNKNGSSDTIGCPSTVTESELEQLLDLQIQFLNDNPISLHLSSDPGMGLNEFIQYLNGKGRRGLYDEYDSLRKRKNFAFIFDNWTRFREFGLQKKTEMIGSLGAEIDSLLDESIYNSDGEASLEALLEPAKVSYAVNANHLPMLDLFTYKNSLKKENVAKNRYSDVLCYDHSRVRLDLSGRESPEPFDGFDLVQTDYINANFVDGFEQKNAFISTQGPLNSTCVDFWEMCISNDVKVIVMTTRTMERQRIKCSQYWPLQPLSQLNFGHLTLINDGVEQFQDYVITKLTLRNNKVRESHYSI